jgi:S-adenosylmethionine/arginine decarboxylase-like enzyme
MKRQKEWGMMVLLDLFDCDVATIRNYKKLKDFPAILCKEIDMQPFGPAQIKRFGKGNLEGYSVFQFIETSTIVIHNDEPGNRLFIDVFSCKRFDPDKVIELSKSYFGSLTVSAKIIMRGVRSGVG